MVSPEFPVLKEGNNLLIKCSFSKDKEIQTVGWYKDKKRVTKNVVVVSAFESVLRISNATKSDAGVYECRVTDFGVGYWVKSATVKVEGMCSTFSNVGLRTILYMTISFDATHIYI